MSSTSDMFDFDFKYLFLFVAVVTTAYFFQDKDNLKIFTLSDKVAAESKEDIKSVLAKSQSDTDRKEDIKSVLAKSQNDTNRVDLGSSTSGECFNNQFSSEKGAVKINGSSFYTNWREVKFKYCVESNNKHYLVAETYGNKAVGYLVFDDIDKPRNIDNYGCVLHNELKIIKQKPADFLPVDCSRKGLERLASNSP